MEFLADENIKRRAIEWLRRVGHEVALAPKGVSDRVVADVAKRARRVVLTHDSDFADAHKFPPAQFAGIVWLSLQPPTLTRVVKALDHVLAKLPPEAFAGKLIDVSDIDRFQVLP